MVRVAEVIRDDIRSRSSDWETVRKANCSDYEISVLRAYDIVAWRCGNA